MSVGVPTRPVSVSASVPAPAFSYRKLDEPCPKCPAQISAAALSFDTGSWMREAQGQLGALAQVHLWTWYHYSLRLAAESIWPESCDPRSRAKSLLVRQCERQLCTCMRVCSSRTSSCRVQGQIHHGSSHHDVGTKLLQQRNSSPPPPLTLARANHNDRADESTDAD